MAVGGRTVLVAAFGLVAAGCASGASDSSDPTSARVVEPPLTSSVTTIAASTTPAAAGPTTTVDDATVGDGPLVGLAAIGRFDMPTDVTGRPGDEAIYVAERGGKIKALPPSAREATTVLDLTADTSIDSFYEGLLGLTFSPQGDVLFVHFSDKAHDTVIAAFDVGPERRADPATRRELLRVARPKQMHHGGDLHFGPDGYLYVALGDGADRPSHALDLDSLDGKLLRLDPTATNPGDAAAPGGPFVDRGGRPEIWSIGLRNPWRFSFDRATGDLWIADVGEERLEEVDVAPASSDAGRGWNYGWSAFEGSDRFADHEPLGDEHPPDYDYAHSDDDGCSINGGFVYRGTNVPALQGWYVFSDYCAPTLRALRLQPGAEPVVRRIPTGLAEIVTFGEDDDGELLVAVLGGEVYRVVAP
jgi:glucose/arabinose dehydrogenase